MERAMKRPFLVLAGLVFLALLITVQLGCGPGDSSPKIGGSTAAEPPTQTTRTQNTTQPSDVLDGSEWRLVSINGTGPVALSYLSLFFRHGTVWGFSGINTYGGRYQVEGPGKLVFSDVLSTAMGGPEDLAQQEGTYLKVLSTPASYRLEGTGLQISGAASTGQLVFERLPEYPMDRADLIGTKWQLVSLDGESVLEGLSITLNFDSDTRASGRAGPFVYELSSETQSYRPVGDDIRWGIMVRREGDAPSDVQKQAAAYTSAIGFAAKYRLSTGRLEIFTANGKTLVFAPLAGTVK